MIYKCKMCKGDLEIIDQENGLCECESCGSRQTVPLENNERKAELYNTANQYRKENLFDKAINVYDVMVKEFPNEAEAYWGIVLCRYGIEYVKDPKTEKMIPTCHRTISKPIFEDPDYKLACQKSNSLARKQHEEEAEVIDTLQKKIFLIAQKEEPFDIFISYKELDDESKQRTEDSVLAQEIYSKLTNEGYKVFFSRITLEKRLGEDYEPIIYSALNSSKVLLLVGTSNEHMNAPWVRNEWSRYLDMIDNEEGSKTLIPVYAKMNPYDIPSEINGRHIQAQDAMKIGFQQDLLYGIQKIFNSNKKSVAPINSGIFNSNANIGGMIERGFICLKDKNFEEAKEIFNQILNIDPHSAGAYLGRLMIKRKVTDVDELKNETYAFSNESDYRHVLEYGDPKIKKKLREFNKNIIEANKKYVEQKLELKIENLQQEIANKEVDSENREGVINNLKEKSKEPQAILNKVKEITEAVKKSELIILVIYLLMFAKSIFNYILDRNIFGIVVSSIIAFLIYSYVVKKYISPIIAGIISAGKPNDMELSQAVAMLQDIDNTIKENNQLIIDNRQDIGKKENQIKRINDNKSEFIESLCIIQRSLVPSEIDRLVD